MKDMNKLKDYRLKYKRYYGIDFGDNYVIHHIDLNHNNNNIKNLVLLPKELHGKYHNLLEQLNNISMNMKITGNGLFSQSYFLWVQEKFLEALKECNKWFDFKMYLEGIMPNIHNISLEDLKK